MKLTGAGILVSCGIKVLQAAPAAYPYRSPAESMRRCMSQLDEVADPDCFDLMIARFTPTPRTEESRIKTVRELDERLAGIMARASPRHRTLRKKRSPRVRSTTPSRARHFP
jgi:hypothetical protein